MVQWFASLPVVLWDFEPINLRTDQAVTATEEVYMHLRSRQLTTQLLTACLAILCLTIPARCC